MNRIQGGVLRLGREMRRDHDGCASRGRGRSECKVGERRDRGAGGYRRERAVPIVIRSARELLDGGLGRHRHDGRNGRSRGTPELAMGLRW